MLLLHGAGAITEQLSLLVAASATAFAQPPPLPRSSISSQPLPQLLLDPPSAARGLHEALLNRCESALPDASSVAAAVGGQLLLLVAALAIASRAFLCKSPNFR